MNCERLIKQTSAYKIIAGDKASGTLSHAYLIVCADEKYLRNYMRLFARLAFCSESATECGNCRICKLITAEKFTDVKFIPENQGDKIVVEDIENLIEDSFTKPFESDKKLYVICGAEQMTVAAQNKLLKTLEEPPKGVHILLGVNTEYPLLQTVKSRVKTLVIPPFSNEVLYENMVGEYTDTVKLKQAIASGNGTLGRAETLYSDDKLEKLSSLATDIIVNMKSSKDVLGYSAKVLKYKDCLIDFVSTLQMLFRDMLIEFEGGTVWNESSKGLLSKTQGFNEGAILTALEKTAEAAKRLSFNVNDVMLVDWLLFAILEGKYKWQRL